MFEIEPGLIVTPIRSTWMGVTIHTEVHLSINIFKSIIPIVSVQTVFQYVI